MNIIAQIILKTLELVISIASLASSAIQCKSKKYKRDKIHTKDKNNE